MVWTKYHMASLIEKCGRAKFIRSHSSRACWSQESNMNLLEVSNNIDPLQQVTSDDEGLLLAQASSLPERARTSCTEQPSHSTDIPSDF